MTRAEWTYFSPSCGVGPTASAAERAHAPEPKAARRAHKELVPEPLHVLQRQVLGCVVPAPRSRDAHGIAYVEWRPIQEKHMRIAHVRELPKVRVEALKHDVEDVEPARTHTYNNITHSVRTHIYSNITSSAHTFTTTSHTVPKHLQRHTQSTLKHLTEDIEPARHAGTQNADGPHDGTRARIHNYNQHRTPQCPNDARTHTTRTFRGPGATGCAGSAWIRERISPCARPHSDIKRQRARIRKCVSP